MSKPEAWSKKKVQAWLKALDGGAFVAHLPAFEGISGTRIACMDVKEVQRLCGAAASCAAFNDPAFAGVRTPEEEAEAAALALAAEAIDPATLAATLAAEKAAKEAAQDAARADGQRIYSAFSKARRAAKK